MLGIILVNYNDWDNLINCVNSINASNKCNIYIVDNDSKPHEYINELKLLENVTLIMSKINLGYSAGNNLGLKSALDDGCDCFIVSNTDIVFLQDTIKKLISTFENSDVDVAGPKVYLEDGLEQEEILGVRVTPIEKIKLIINSFSKGLAFKNLKRVFSNKDRENQYIYRVYGVSGCCFAFNLRVAHEVLPFDENVFLYNEEWIIAEICHQRDLKVVVNPLSIVTHLHGSTTKDIKLVSYLYFLKSEWYVLNAYFRDYLFLNIVIAFLRLPRLVYVYSKEMIKNSLLNEKFK
jgi:GT2 family glycosyltransferase